jgi:hypothetical protein
MDYTKELLTISKTDLVSSRTLHVHGQFSQAYFLFQQAVEKANKAFGLLTGVVKQDDLMKVGHDQIKIFKKGLKEQELKIDEHNKIIEHLDHIKNHEFYKTIPIASASEKIGKADSFLDSLRNMDLVRIDADVVDLFISELIKLRDEKLTEIENYDREIIDQLKITADWIGSFGTEESLRQKSELMGQLADNQSQEVLLKYCKDTSKVIVEIAYVNMTLYLFAILTIQHSSRTRYIIEETRPVDIYNTDLPVIIKLPQLIDLLEEAINRLEKLNEDIGHSGQQNVSSMVR